MPTHNISITCLPMLCVGEALITMLVQQLNLCAKPYASPKHLHLMRYRCVACLLASLLVSLFVIVVSFIHSCQWPENVDF